MNRRSFLQAGAALAVNSALPVPVLATLQPKLVGVKWARSIMTHQLSDKYIGSFIPFYKHWIYPSDQSSLLVTLGTGIIADHGQVFVCNGEELGKHAYSLLWENLKDFKETFKDGNFRYQYETGPFTFRLPRMQRPYSSNANTHL